MAGSNTNTLYLDQAASNQAHAYALFAVSVTTGSNVSSAVFSTYSSGRAGNLHSNLQHTIAPSSTYSVSSVPKAYFGNVADWTRTSGILILTMSPPTTLMASISSSATGVQVADVKVSNIQIGSFLRVDSELLLVTGLSEIPSR